MFGGKNPGDGAATGRTLSRAKDGWKVRGGGIISCGEENQEKGQNRMKTKQGVGLAKICLRSLGW